MVQHYGFKVSPKGSDVKTVSDQDARFSSKFASLQAYRWGNFNFTTNASGIYTHEIPHPLSYAPGFDAFLKGTANFSFITPTTFSNAWFPLGGSNRWFGGEEMAGFTVDSDPSKLYIHARDGFKASSVFGKYYLFRDRAELFTGPSSIELTNDLGLKISAEGKSVLTAEEYDMLSSSKYKTLQYFKESIKEETLTLPAMWASYADQDVQEATYVDFLHGLGYPPFFWAFFQTSSALRRLPYMETDVAYEPGEGYFTDPVYEVSAWSDATRIRVTFWRRSRWITPDFVENVKHDPQTITIRVLPFAENLEGLNYGQ